MKLDSSVRRISVRITYSTLTEESVFEGDHAGNGFMYDNGNRQVDGDDSRPEWSLREALAFMADKCSHIETCWMPGNHSWFAGTGNTSDCEGDEIEVCYDLHVDGVSDGTMMRLARVLKANGVYFANTRHISWNNIEGRPIHAGTEVRVSAHTSKPGEGLTYPVMFGTLLEPCETQGWDVIDVQVDGETVSVYSFDVSLHR